MTGNGDEWDLLFLSFKFIQPEWWCFISFKTKWEKNIYTHTHNIFLKTGIITRKLGLVKVSKYIL